MAIIGTLSDDGDYFRVSVRLTREDIDALDDEARKHDMVLGYYLDLLVAGHVNALRMRDGLPPRPTPMASSADVWKKEVPR